MDISSAASPSFDEVLEGLFSLGDERAQNVEHNDIFNGILSDEDLALACNEGLENFSNDLPNDTGTDFFNVSCSCRC